MENDSNEQESLQVPPAAASAMPVPSTPSATSMEMPKRKRGRPKTQAILPVATNPTASVAASTGSTQEEKLQPNQTQPQTAPTAVIATNTVAKAARKKVSKKKFSLTVFDKDALKLIRRKFASAQGISSKLGVGEPAVAQRLQEIVKAGLLEGNENGFHLTVKGYNEYAPDSLETSFEENLRKKEESARNKQLKLAAKNAEKAAQAMQPAQTQLQLPLQNELAVRKSGEIIVLPENGASALQPERNRVEQRESQTEKVDLSELLARGAPKPGGQVMPASSQKPRRSEKTVAEITVTPKASAPSPGAGKQAEGDKCVLCRTGFVLSVSGGNPKYGHCFCGAAYHQDCYQGVLEASGECIQCGKKLDTNFDKASLDEVRKIKDVFG